MCQVIISISRGRAAITAVLAPAMRFKTANDVCCARPPSRLEQGALFLIRVERYRHFCRSAERVLPTAGGSISAVSVSVVMAPRPGTCFSCLTPSHAIMDRASHAVLAGGCPAPWTFAVAALEALGRREIFNTGRGGQFTSTAFADVLSAAGVRISMDGRGRWMDWRSLNHEGIYFKGYAHGSEAHIGIPLGSSFTTPGVIIGRQTIARRLCAG
jgi:hypothetical protein